MASGTDTPGPVGWATFTFPSPRPSPLGRGRIVRWLWAIPAADFAKPVWAQFAAGGGCSLSPRERVRVRGTDGSTAVSKESPSPPSNGGEGWGEEERFVRLPLSSVLSPLL